MDIQITGRNVALDDELRAHVERRLSFALGRFERRIQHIDVRLTDLNGPRRGLDQNCRIAVHLRPRGDIVVQDRSADPLGAVSAAAARVGTAVRRRLERRRDARVRGPSAA